MPTKTYHPAFVQSRVDEQIATRRWGVLITIPGTASSLLPESFETYSEAEARADELNHKVKREAWRDII